MHSSQWGNCDRKGDFKVICRVLVDVQVHVCNSFVFLDRGWRENRPPHLKGNISSPIKFINCAMCPENKTGKCFFHFPPSKNSTQNFSQKKKNSVVQCCTHLLSSKYSCHLLQIKKNWYFIVRFSPPRELRDLRPKVLYLLQE